MYWTKTCLWMGVFLTIPCFAAFVNAAPFVDITYDFESYTAVIPWVRLTPQTGRMVQVMVASWSGRPPLAPVAPGKLP